MAVDHTASSLAEDLEDMASNTISNMANRTASPCTVRLPVIHLLSAEEDITETDSETAVSEAEEWQCLFWAALLEVYYSATCSATLVVVDLEAVDLEAVDSVAADSTVDGVEEWAVVSSEQSTWIFA